MPLVIDIPPLTDQEIDDLVDRFAEAMKAKLKARRDKGTWKTYGVNGAIFRITQEYGEVASASTDTEKGKECIDLANVAAFLWDITGRPKW